PDFWDNQKEAEAQMRKIKELRFWLEGYDELEKIVDELALGFDFVKDELIDESELDKMYCNTISYLENLELKNMLRHEEDKLGVVLKINSGAGGTESQDWA
ncbi:MAG: PCRF domain-containing protein, partial [Muribaculaceae bacterium]